MSKQNFGFSSRKGIPFLSSDFMPVSGDISNWNTAYGWGDHAGLYSPLGHVHNWTEIAGVPAFLTTESDPIFAASPAYVIGSGDISNWNAAYGWGNHGAAGYAFAANVWSKLGNTGTNPASDYIGTIDSQPLIFKTSSIESARIFADTRNWNIGGTIDAGYKLDVTGWSIFRSELSVVRQISVFVPSGANPCLLLLADGANNADIENYSGGKLNFKVANSRTAIELSPKTGWGDYTETKIHGKVQLTGYNIWAGEYFLDVSGKTRVQGQLNLKNYTVATLPTPTRGDTCYVTDALAPVMGSAVVGGGAIAAMVWYNGTAWTVTGI